MPPEAAERIDFDLEPFQASLQETLRAAFAGGTSASSTPTSSDTQFSTRVLPSLSPEVLKASIKTRPVNQQTLMTPRDNEPGTRLIPLNEWEGVVHEVRPSEGIFTAVVVDLTNKQSPQEYAEFLLDDIGVDDLALATSGAVFRWVIGKRESPFGQVERISKLVFRRLPAYRKSDFEEADRWSEQIVACLTDERCEPACS